MPTMAKHQKWRNRLMFQNVDTMKYFSVPESLKLIEYKK
jgi:hypothetical protein